MKEGTTTKGQMLVWMRPTYLGNEPNPLLLGQKVVLERYRYFTTSFTWRFSRVTVTMVFVANLPRRHIEEWPICG